MAEARVQRRLAAILAADVVRYSRMMEADEEGTLARLKKLRADVIDPKLAENGGRVFKTTGDGFLAEFPSAVDAVRHAIDVQRAISEFNADLPDDNRISFRVGISLGDVLVDGDDLFGDGVNVAVRMEGLAEAGGICISGNVHEHVSHSLDVGLEDLGEQTVKNIERPIRCYRIRSLSNGDQETHPSAPLWNKPAVAVLPFENMSGDPEQEYFADGLTEDIITALSLWRTFPVIARNSTFSYRDQSPDIRRVGAELNARYLVEGSVRKSGNRVRVTAQLINAETGHHIWADRFDRELADVFELQDELTHRIATAIEPTIGRSEGRRVRVKPPSDLVAWELVLRGFELIYEETKEANEEARRTFQRAIEIDPQFARAYTGLSYTYVKDLRFFGTDDRKEALDAVLASARRAVALDEMDAEARTGLARALNFNGQREASIAEARRGVELNPLDPYANVVLGGMLGMGSGRYDEAIPCLEKAVRLSPKDPQNHIFVGMLALAYLGAGNYGLAAKYALDVIQRRPNYFESVATLAAAQAYLGETEKAQATIGPFAAEARELVERNGMFGRETKDVILDGLRKAGLPE